MDTGGGAILTGGYCWPTSFKVLGVLFLEEVSSAFLPSKKVCWTYPLRYVGVGQQYPGVFPKAGPSHRRNHVFHLLLQSHESRSIRITSGALPFLDLTTTANASKCLCQAFFLQMHTIDVRLLGIGVTQHAGSYSHIAGLCP